MLRDAQLPDDLWPLLAKGGIGGTSAAHTQKNYY
jgi:hypothetical protein